MSRTLLVIPHFNDSARLEPFLEGLMITLPAHFSILISDDGSSRDEKEKLRSLISNFKLAQPDESADLRDPLFTNRNTGKGGAVHRGWKCSEGFSTLAFTDADGAISAGEIVRAESYFRSPGCDADALFGSRIKMLGRTIHRSLLRHLTGRVFATLVSEIGNIPAYDTQCGLKMLTAEAYQKVQSHLCTQGFSFDVELALMILKTGGKIIEFPIDWHDVPGSKVSLFPDSARMVYEVLKIKKRMNSLDGMPEQ